MAARATSLRDKVSRSSASRANSAMPVRPRVGHLGGKKFEIARHVVHGGSSSNFPEYTSPDDNKADRYITRKTVLRGRACVTVTSANADQSTDRPRPRTTGHIRFPEAVLAGAKSI